MPHVMINCFKADIPEERLTRLRSGIAKILQQELGCYEEAISIDLRQVEPQNWREQVYEVLIAPRMKDLLLQPKYGL
jgi:4-oxalocrotonate tautomerase